VLKLFGKAQWVAVDCLTGEYSRVETLPFEIGSGEGVDLKLNGQGVAERHCAVNQVKGLGLCLIKQEPNLPLVVDGESVEYCQLTPDNDYAVKIGAHFLAIRGSRGIDDWLRGLDFSQWSLQDSATNQIDGPMSLEELCQFAKDHQRHPQTLVRPQGLSKGFFLHEAFEVLAAQAAAAPEGGTLPEEDEALRTGEEGLLTCPVCWLKFDVGDIMHLAVHDSLRGDPVLGEDAPNVSWRRALTTAARRWMPWACPASILPARIAAAYCRLGLPKPLTISFRWWGIRARENRTI